MISQALASGKTVLFVAEKMAALNVVHNRLTQLGIGTFCLEMYSNKAQKKDVLQQLETAFNTLCRVRETDWKQASEGIRALVDSGLIEVKGDDLVYKGYVSIR